MGSSEPSTEDGLIEVVGLTTYQLVSKLGLAPSLFILYTFRSHFTSAHFSIIFFLANAIQFQNVWRWVLFQPLLQAGGHGTCITQCRTARIVTSKTIPMQVDGEACKLTPSIITLSLLNKATMLAKRKGGKAPPQTALDNLNICVHRISMSDYEQHHYDKNLLTQAGTLTTILKIL